LPGVPGLLPLLMSQALEGMNHAPKQPHNTGQTAAIQLENPRQMIFFIR